MSRPHTGAKTATRQDGGRPPQGDGRFANHGGPNTAGARLFANVCPGHGAQKLITLDIASTDRHFEQILDLHRRYQIGALSPDVEAREGFVFTEYSIPVLRRMAAVLPQAIALADDVVVGYCLALPPALRDEVPELAPMFEQFERCAYHGRPLSGIRFFVGGQVCVDRAWRRRGLLARLYQQVRRSAPEDYELCVTEIATRNRVSVRAHEKMGFNPISTYADAREQWVVVAWPLRPPATAQ